MTLRKYSDDDVRRLVAAGKTRREIRAALGISRETLRTACLRLNIRPVNGHAGHSGRPQQFSDIDLLCLVNCNRTAKQIAQTFGVTNQCVRCRCRRLGVRTRRPSRTLAS